MTEAITTHRCSHCGQTKPVSEFWRNRSTPSGLSYWCRGCLGPRIRDDRKVRLAAIITEAKNRPCVDCGETYDRQFMWFAYRDPSERKFKIIEASQRGVADIMAEIAKCDVVCRWCGPKRTATRGER